MGCIPGFTWGVVFFEGSTLLGGFQGTFFFLDKGTLLGAFKGKPPIWGVPSFRHGTGRVPGRSNSLRDPLGAMFERGYPYFETNPTSPHPPHPHGSQTSAAPTRRKTQLSVSAPASRSSARTSAGKGSPPSLSWRGVLRRRVLLQLRFCPLEKKTFQ